MAAVYQGHSPIRVVRSVKNEESEHGTGKIQLPPADSLPQMQKALSADQVFLLNALYLENTLTAVANRSFEKRVRELSAR